MLHHPHAGLRLDSHNLPLLRIEPPGTHAATRFAWLIAAGIGSGQMLAGWVGQGAYYGGLTVAIYLLYRCLAGRGFRTGIGDRLRALALAGAVIGIVGGATAAPAVLPRLKSSAALTSPISTTPMMWSPQTWQIRDGALPHLQSCNWQLTHVPGRGSARDIDLCCLPLTAAAACCFFTLFGLGIFAMIIRGSPLIDLFNLLPRFESLHEHSPERLLIMLFLAPAVLAGWLVHTLLDREWRGQDHIRALLVGRS